MSSLYVRLTNGCGRKITLHPHFQRPMKGPSHPPPPIVLAPDAVSRVVLKNDILGCTGWAAVKDCISFEDAVKVPKLVLPTTTSRKRIELAVKVRTVKRGKRRRHKIRISASSKLRAIRADILADATEVRKLKRRKLLKIVPFTPTYPPARGSYGYEDDFYICRDCGRPIIFRGSPAVPIHI